jgi:hypothetical protein
LGLIEYSNQEYFCFLQIMAELFKCQDIIELSERFKTQAEILLGARFFFYAGQVNDGPRSNYWVFTSTNRNVFELFSKDFAEYIESKYLLSQKGESFELWGHRVIPSVAGYKFKANSICGFTFADDFRDDLNRVNYLWFMALACLATLPLAMCLNTINPHSGLSLVRLCPFGHTKKSPIKHIAE